jgi:site-specific recombinase XerD
VNTQPNAHPCRKLGCPKQPMNCGFCKEHYDEYVSPHFDGFIRFMSTRNMRTVERYTYILTWIGVDKLKTLNEPKDLHALYLWMTDREGRLSFSFLKNYNLVYAALRNYLDYAGKKRLKEYVLTQALRLPKKNKVVKHHARDVVEKFINASRFKIDGTPKKQCDGDRDHAFMVFLADTGVRVGGAVSIETTMLDYNKNLIHIPKYEKTGERDVIMSDRLKKVLKEYTTTYNITGLLFDFKPSINKDKQEVWGRYGASEKATLDAKKRYRFFRQVQKAEYMLKTIGKQLEATKVITPHQFRHSLAMFLYKDKSWPLEKVQLVLGHSELSTTQIYASTTILDNKDKFMNDLK